MISELEKQEKVSSNMEETETRISELKQNKENRSLVYDRQKTDSATSRASRNTRDLDYYSSEKKENKSEAKKECSSNNNKKGG